MSLATRCPACGTVFRVVEDQLKISEGWVRCGRCEDVFNAQQSLFDLEREAPPPWSMPSSAPPSSSAVAAPVAAEGAAVADAVSIDDLVASPREAWPADPEPALDAAPASTAAGAPETAGGHRAVPADPHVLQPVPMPSPANEPAPHFMRRAERAASWRRPGVVAALLAASAVLGLLLLAQFGLHWRDALAARWPAARPTLDALCAVAGCRIEPLRRLESLVVDSSGLSQLDGQRRYRFSVVLHNKDSVDILLPALDLTLTDSQGRTLARKVLRAPELGIVQTSLPAAGELAMQTVLDPGTEMLAGYTVEIFYP